NGGLDTTSGAGLPDPNYWLIESAARAMLRSSILDRPPPVVKRSCGLDAAAVRVRVRADLARVARASAGTERREAIPMLGGRHCGAAGESGKSGGHAVVAVAVPRLDDVVHHAVMDEHDGRHHADAVRLGDVVRGQVRRRVERPTIFAGEREELLVRILPDP